MFVVLVIKCCTSDDSVGYECAKKLLYMTLVLSILGTTVLLGFVLKEHFNAFRETISDRSFINDDLAPIQECFDRI